MMPSRLFILEVVTGFVSASIRSRLLFGPPMLADKANFGSVRYNHAYFYRIEETSMYWLVERISVFSRCITVHRPTSKTCAGRS